MDGVSRHYIKAGSRCLDGSSSFSPYLMQRFCTIVMSVRCLLLHFQCVPLLQRPGSTHGRIWPPADAWGETSAHLFCWWLGNFYVTHGYAFAQVSVSSLLLAATQQLFRKLLLLRQVFIRNFGSVATFCRCVRPRRALQGIETLFLSLQSKRYKLLCGGSWMTIPAG